MSRNRKIGIYGEELAEKHLLEDGYRILERNWRSRHKEIDIIAMKDNIICFIEVKTRSSTRHGMPEEAVSESKANSVTSAAQDYLDGKNIRDIRFDIISVILFYGQEPEILHIRDAFY
ncbi:MAG: YraN family protein [Chitinophagaceae bacterium]|nr:YraN family protein [Chitinophagaceae bacterium]